MGLGRWYRAAGGMPVGFVLFSSASVQNECSKFLIQTQWYCLFSGKILDCTYFRSKSCCVRECNQVLEEKGTIQKLFLYKLEIWKQPRQVPELPDA